MGLEIYLYRDKKYKDTDPATVRIIDQFLGLQRAKAKYPETYGSYSLEHWCGISDDKLPEKETIDFYTKLQQFRYYYDDKSRRCPCMMISENVGYWRSAYGILRWLTNNVTNGENYACQHYVTQNQIIMLREDCQSVLKDDISPALKERFSYEEGEGWDKENLQSAVEICNEILDDTDFEKEMISCSISL